MHKLTLAHLCKQKGSSLRKVVDQFIRTTEEAAISAGWQNVRCALSWDRNSDQRAYELQALLPSSGPTGSEPQHISLVLEPSWQPCDVTHPSGTLYVRFDHLYKSTSPLAHIATPSLLPRFAQELQLRGWNAHICS